MSVAGPQRAVGFDVLRLFAALVVVVQHSFGAFGLSGVGAAVTLIDGVGVFFVISGMLLSRSAERATGAGGWRRYALSRYVRIVPALVPFVLIVPVLAMAIAPTAGTASSSVQWSWWYLGAFFGLPLASPGLFDGTDVNAHLWTIPAEVSFYAVLPVLVVLARRWGRRRVIIVFVLACLALELCARSAGGFLPALTHHTFIERAAYFGVGMWLARGSARGTWVTAGLAFAAYLGLRWSRTIDGAELVFSDLGTPVLSIVAAVLVGHVVAVVGTRAVVFENLVRRVGDLSYGMYIWHPLVILVLVLGGWAGASALVAALVVSAACGAVSWWVIERPSLLAARTRLAVAPQPARSPVGQRR